MCGRSGFLPESKQILPSDVALIKAFSEIHIAAFRQMGEQGWNEASVKQTLESAGVIGFVFGDQKNVIGALMLRIVCDEAELITVAVHPNYQSKGIAKQILDFMLIYLREQNIIKCFLEVRKDNAKAVALYSKIGFEQFGVRRLYYKTLECKRVDALLFSYNLSIKK